ncbi:aspartate aminotransferase family protein [Companilactobacillus halodurans]|uniref:Aspartate aminotransferase family protein n=1 Tax=Companilactobacillus halodurans TaxID=2584183 RepID=A0A5P0ZRE3_9LACO|nr:aspartate aminotransferase family protein [Companilactobacillus halodurans]MQS76776.1 aspartate aminotransferase family protein [Companilactobacillus halodurans]MQS98027.1 aspartate aminotransferase family protein [Companilactobacillus halodurans]
MTTQEAHHDHEVDHRLIMHENEAFSKASRINYFDLVIESAHNSTLVDADGNEYIDLLASASSINVGHTNEKVVRAIQRQAQKLIHYTSAYFPNRPEQELIERLSQTVPGAPKEVSLANSGSEANDAIIKFARGYTGRPYIVSFMDSYHGSTYGSMTLSGVSLNMARKMGPLLPDVVHVPYPDLYRRHKNETEHDVAVRYFEEFKQPFESYLPADEVACILIEPIQGDGGIRKAPEEFMQLVYEFCHQNGILFAVDEINQGLGRTGKMWSYQQFQDIEPDLMSVGKSLASGMPLSATIGKKEIMESLDSPAHTFTTAGNPICCAASLATLDVLKEQKLLLRSLEKGNYAKKKFLELQNRYPEIGDVRMYGLNGGIELVKDQKTKVPDADFANKIIYYAFMHGVLMITLKGNILRFQPPLVITQEELDYAFDVLNDAFKAAENNQVIIPSNAKIGW